MSAVDGATLEDRRGEAQVLDAAVGARPDEDRVDLDLAQRRAGLEAHVVQGLLGGDLVVGLVEVVGARDVGTQRRALAGVGAPGDERRHGRRVELDLLVEDGVVVGAQGLPVCDRGVPVGSLGGLGLVGEVVEGGLVGCDEAGLGAPLDRHVADRHPALHGELLDGLAAVLHDVALAAAGAGVRDQGEHQVLGGDAVRQAAVDGDGHRLGPGLRQGLGGEHVLDLGGADAERDRAEGTVGRGVGVAAHDRHARLGQPELGADDVDDALLDVAERVEAYAEVGAVLAQRLDLRARDRIGDRLVPVDRRDVVVLGREGEVGSTYGAVGETESVEGLRRRHLVEEVEVDVEEVGLPRRAADDVLVPDLLGQGLAHDTDLLLSPVWSCGASTLHLASHSLR